MPLTVVLRLPGVDVPRPRPPVRLVLTEERPVVGKETVPVERVRLGKETTTEERQVTDQVRKEQIELDDQTGSERK